LSSILTTQPNLVGLLFWFVDQSQILQDYLITIPYFYGPQGKITSLNICGLPLVKPRLHGDIALHDLRDNFTNIRVTTL